MTPNHPAGHSWLPDMDLESERGPDSRLKGAMFISLGQKLNMRVIAEGVETEEQLAFLRDNQCDEIQGYHFSKPISAVAIENLLTVPDASRHRKH